MNRRELMGAVATAVASAASTASAATNQAVAIKEAPMLGEAPDSINREKWKDASPASGRQAVVPLDAGIQPVFVYAVIPDRPLSHEAHHNFVENLRVATDTIGERFGVRLGFVLFPSGVTIQPLNPPPAESADAPT